MNFNYPVPFSRNGTLIHQIQENEDPEWRENTPFRATLSIDWLEPGASVKRVMVLRGQGQAYPMFVDDLVEMLRHCVVLHGDVSGEWRVKRTGRARILYTIVRTGD